MDGQAQDYQMQGIALMGEEKYLEAKKVFKKGLEIEPSVSLYRDYGNACASLADYKEAIKAFNNGLNIEPNNGDLLFSIGSVYFLEEKIKNCLEYYNRAEKAGYTGERLYLNLSTIYHFMGDIQMELRCYSRAIEKNPLVASFYIKKVQLLIELGQPEVAIDVLESLESIYSETFEVYELKSRIYYLMGKSAMAMKVLEDALAKYPKDINLMVSRIQLLVDQNKMYDAEIAINNIKRNEYYELVKRTVLLLEVSIASSRNEPQKMVTLLNEILEKEEGCDEQVRFMLMMTYNVLLNYQKALEHAKVLNDQTSDTPFSISGIYYTGEFLMKLDRKEEAKTQLKIASRRLRKLNASNRAYFEVYIYRALTYKLLGEYEKAIEMGQFIIDLQPDRPDGYMTLADIYREMGDLEKSEEQYKIVEEKDPTFRRK